MAVETATVERRFIEATGRLVGKVDCDRIRILKKVTVPTATWNQTRAPYVQ